MSLPALLPGQVALRKTSLCDSRNNSVLLTTGEKVCWVQAKFAEKNDRIPLERLSAENGIGPFKVVRIYQNPTGSICFEFFNSKGEFKKVNKNYFAKWTK